MTIKEFSHQGAPVDHLDQNRGAVYTVRCRTCREKRKFPHSIYMYSLSRLLLEKGSNLDTARDIAQGHEKNPNNLGQEHQIEIIEILPKHRVILDGDGLSGDDVGPTY